MKTLITLASAMTIGSLLASPQATQNWVKKYHREHSNASADVIARKLRVTAEFPVADQYGVTGMVRIAFGYATNDALRVSSSEIANLPNGLLFAKDTRPSAMTGTYRNGTNAFCTTITKSYEPMRYKVTNAGTNIVYNDCLTVDTTQGAFKAWRFGSSYYGHLHVGTNYQKIVFSNAKIFDRTRNALLVGGLASARRFSFFDLLFPSAMADEIVQPSFHVEPESTYYKTEEDDLNIYYHYRQHWHVDADATSTIGVESFTWKDKTFNGVADKMVICVPAGHVEDISVESVNFFENYTGSFVVDDSGTTRLPRNVFLNSEAYQSAQDQFNTAKDTFTQLISSRQDDCPLEDDYITTEAKQQEDSQKPESSEEGVTENDPPSSDDRSEIAPPPLMEGCGHIAKGRCGNWTCVYCKGKLTGGPQTHVFVDATPNSCTICKNRYNEGSPICGAQSTDWHDHSNWEKENNASCRCLHGHGAYSKPHTVPSWTWLPNEEDPLIGHYKKGYCNRCNKNLTVAIYQNEGPHAHEYYSAVNGTVGGVDTCKWSVVCYTCQHSKEEYHPHEQTEFDYFDNGNGTHTMEWRCAKCNTWGHYAGSPAAHIPDMTPGLYELVNDGVSGHHTNRLCSICVSRVDKKTRVIVSGETVPHELKWELSNTPLVDDQKTCDCGFSTNVLHHYVYNDTIHYCDNGGVHLYGFHQWNASDTNLCSVCGYRRGVVPSGDIQTRTVTCNCGSCYIVETRTRKDAQSTWGPWGVTTTHCAWGWDHQNHRCGCSMCALGYYSSCVCEHPTPTWWPWISADTPISPSNLPISGSN